MKKIIALVLCAFMLAFLMAACGEKEESKASENTEAGDAPATEAPTAAPTEPPTKAPTEPRTRPTRPVFEELVILDCSTLDYNKMGAVKLSEENPAPGFTASWLSPASAGPEIFKAVFPAVDVTVNDYMTGAVKMVIWCPDAGEAGSGDNQFELSTKTNDAQENNWPWTDQLEDGWNTIYLLWDDVRISEPDPDNTSLTWIRIYSVGREVDFMLARVSLVPYEQIPDDKLWW
ncbi:MAG: hypothetical protein FWD23_13375 [Oscillospiraceae bacterium]|nr:hypothetical protein [Oscillospiraceae bacterium]